jgi:chaperone modulatory protein CbpM
MTFNTREFLVRAALDEATLDIWIAEGWLVPDDGDERLYRDADLARAHLIRDLMDDLGVNAEGVGVILHLLDQMHGLRGALSESSAVYKNRG